MTWVIHKRDLWGCLRSACVFVAMVLLAAPAIKAQPNTRLLIESGWGVPGHSGFAFGPFSDLAMNEAGEIAFLSTLRSARSEIHAVVRSSGVSFSVVAFEGLLAPVPRTMYESFSAPSLNNAGVTVFTAAVKGEQGALVAVIRVEGGTARAIAVSGTSPPDKPQASFVEFSPPLVNAAGNVLFAARLGGRVPSTGLFLWTPQGIRTVNLPAEIVLRPDDLLKPIFFGHDAAVFVSRKAAPDLVVDQFFRAAAIKNFEELNPPPALSETVEALPARPGASPVSMVLALMEGENVPTEMLQGDPTRAVMVKRTPGAAIKPFARIQGQTTGVRGNIIFAAAPAEQESDLGLYCLCEGQVVRLTSPEEFLPVTQTTGGKPILSLVGDARNTAAFITPGSDASAIYVTSLP